MDKGFVIGGTNSGCGKTTISLAMMACFKRKGFSVSPFKVGPDFIDPGHHSIITDSNSYNLDGWMMDKSYNQNLFDGKRSDLSIVEGVMGLYDGYDGTTENGSTAQIAKWINLPVVLVVNAKSMARSAAAVVSGFEKFDPDLGFAGVIFNNIGSPNHLNYLRDALKGHVEMPCLGGIPRNLDVEIPERHLGLVTSDEHFLNEKNMNTLADMIEDNIDLEMLLSPVKITKRVEKQKNENTVTIAVARDKAFCFYYHDNIEILESMGAEIKYFSPIADKKLPEGIDGIYFGGGYPELFGKELQSNKEMREEVKKYSDAGLPIYGECGGFMYLCSDLIDHGEGEFEMTGCFPFKTKMLNKRKALGYREITISGDTVLGQDVKARGHEFHYSELENDQEYSDFVYKVTPRNGLNLKEEGYVVNKTLGSYIHLHFGSNMDVAENFVKSCKEK
ncbi:MAG: cobyrinate a,c-diamide synthase [Desulfobacterales bacterium]|nr:cobyrinate a,c-diamide synthase [Desulfobacterales bacterium]MCP4159071.1 cobyrinate a,c-diamide synthase [Deltaproteobacteria bacterium]